MVVIQVPTSRALRSDLKLLAKAAGNIPLATYCRIHFANLVRRSRAASRKTKAIK